MITKYDRNNYLDKFIVEGALEADLKVIAPDIDGFDFGPMTEAIVVSPDHIGRPDLIALDVLGDHRFWWLLMLINNIEDIWNDIQIGSVLKYPSLAACERFLIWLGQQEYAG